MSEASGLFKKVLAHLLRFKHVERFVMRGKGPVAMIMRNASQASKAAASFARGAYWYYVSTEKWRERRWWLFSTAPYKERTGMPTQRHVKRTVKKVANTATKAKRTASKKTASVIQQAKKKAGSKTQKTSRAISSAKKKAAGAVKTTKTEVKKKAKQPSRALTDAKKKAFKLKQTGPKKTAVGLKTAKQKTRMMKGKIRGVAKRTGEAVGKVVGRAWGTAERVANEAMKAGKRLID